MIQIIDLLHLVCQILSKGENKIYTYSRDNEQFVIISENESIISSINQE